MKNAHLSLLNNLKYILCGHVRTLVMLSIFFWTIYLYDLARNCIDKLQLFQWVLIVFLLCLTDKNQADVVEAFIYTSRFLDVLLNNDNPYIEQMVSQIYLTELQLNKTNSFDTEASFLDLDLPIPNGVVSSKSYDKWGDCTFEIVNFPFLE